MEHQAEQSSPRPACVRSRSTSRAPVRDFCQPLLQRSINAARGLRDRPGRRCRRAWRGLYRSALRPDHRRPAAVAARRSHLSRDVGHPARAARVGASVLAAERDEMNRVGAGSRRGPTASKVSPGCAGASSSRPCPMPGMATMVAVVKHAGLPFDAVLTAELAHTLQTSARRLPVCGRFPRLPARPQIMMVACHSTI